MLPFTDPIKPDCRFLFKPIRPCLTEGCHVDVWLPKEPSGPCPISILAHGGVFCQGCTSDVAANQIEWMLAQGVICVSVEYRLAPHASINEIRKDLVDAYLYVQTKLQHDIRDAQHDVLLDTERCIVSGGSAGGTSTIFMAADIERLRLSDPTVPPIRAVIPAFPLCHWSYEGGNERPRSALKEMYGDKPEWETIKALLDQPVCCADPFPEDVFNPDLTQPRIMFIRAAFSSKSINSYVVGQDTPYSETTSILGSLTSSFPPCRVMCAMKDSLIPVAHSFDLVKTLKGLDVDCEAVRVEEAEHGFTDLPAKYFPEHAQKWWDESIQPTLEWALEKARQ